MSHLKFASYSPPGYHKDFERKVNSLEYQYEGPLRVGVIRPYLSEWKMYDVRIIEPLQSIVCRDLKINTYSDGTYLPNHHSPAAWILRWVVNVIRAVTGIKGVPTYPGVSKMDIASHSEKILIGAIPDVKQKRVVTGKMEEIL